MGATSLAGGFLLVGVTSVLSQTLFTRELVNIFYGSEIALGFILAGWLIFTALGSYIGRRFEGELFFASQVGMGVVLPLEYLFIRNLRTVIHVPLGMIFPLEVIALLSFVALTPIAVLNGMLFVNACDLYEKIKKSAVKGITSVYVIDAIGDMTGGLLYGYLFVRMFSLPTLFLFMGANLISATYLRFKRWRFVGYIIIAAVPLAFRLEKPIMRMAYPGYEVMDYEHSIYHDIVLTQRVGLNTVFVNGGIAFSYPLEEVTELQTYFPLVETPQVDYVAIVTDNPQVVEATLKFNPDTLYWLMLDKQYLRLVVENLRPNFVGDTRVKVVIGDQRLKLKRWEGPLLDAVLLDVGDPLSALSNRFYTVEFFDEIASILKPTGVLFLRISSDPTYFSYALLAYNGSVYRSLKSVFQTVTVIPGETLFLIASKDGSYHSLVPDTLEMRCYKAGVMASYFRAGYLYGMLLPERIRFVTNKLESYKGKLNHDFHPVAAYYHLIHRSYYFAGYLGKLFWWLQNVPTWVSITLWVAIITAVVGLSRGYVRRRILEIGMIGFAAMGVNILLLTGFQIIYGYLYHYLGILSGIFMLGLTVGAIRGRQKGNLKLIEAGILGFMFILCGILWVTRTYTWWMVMHCFPILNFVMGYFVGCAFPIAIRSLVVHGVAGKYAASILYTADLVGSFIGAIFVPFIFMPLYGVFATLIFMGVPFVILLIL